MKSARNVPQLCHQTWGARKILQLNGGLVRWENHGTNCWIFQLCFMTSLQVCANLIQFIRQYQKRHYYRCRDLIPLRYSTHHIPLLYSKGKYAIVIRVHHQALRLQNWVQSFPWNNSRNSLIDITWYHYVLHITTIQYHTYTYVYIYIYIYILLYVYVYVYIYIY